MVDDNPSARVILSRYLTAFDYEVDAVGDGEHALQQLETAGDRPYDLVLTDWKMPGMDGVEVARRIADDPLIKHTPAIIMVTAFDREALNRQVGDVPIDGVLTKPVSPSVLFDGILSAFGKGAALRSQDGDSSQPQRLAGARLLLVEDNAINQQVAQEILAAAGAEVTIADDGQQGVDSVHAAPDYYDAVLMDVQMPVMDGYQATRALRTDSRFTDLPIIAMTANAMVSDQEDARDAGMDDHIAKPIDVAELFDVLQRWVKVPTERRQQAMHASATATDSSTAASQTSATAELPSLPGIDSAAAIARVGGNAALYRDILSKFHQGQADSIERIEQALHSSNHDSAERLAHTLKGTAGSIGADALQRAAADLEAAIKNRDDGLHDHLKTTRQQLTDILTVLATLPPASSAATTPTEPDTPNKHAPIQALLQQLQQQLTDNDADAADTLEQLRGAVSDPAASKGLAGLASAIDDFDFDLALELLPTLPAQLTD